MNYRCIAATFLLSTAALATPVTSWAQGTTDEATTSMARARFKEGVGYYDKGQFEMARASFLQAYALKKHPAILLNLAWSCLKSGHALEGARYFKQFLTDAKDITDKQRSDANDGLSQARAKLGQIDVTGAPGLDVTIDGDHVGTTPLAEPVLVEVGTHAIHVKAPDGTLDMQSLTVLGGEKQTARFRTIPIPPPPPAPVAAPPPAQVAPPPPQAAIPPPPPPPPAPVAPSPPPPPVQEAAKPAETAPNEVPTESSPSSSSSMPLWPGFVGLGITAVGAIVGGVALSSVATAQNNANNQASNILAVGGMCPPTPPPPNANASYTMQYQQLIAACGKYSDDNNLVKVDRTVGWVSLGVGAVFLAGSITYLVVAVTHNNAHQGSTQAMLVPMVGPSLSGMSVVGTF